MTLNGVLFGFAIIGFAFCAYLIGRIEGYSQALREAEAGTSPRPQKSEGQK